MGLTSAAIVDLALSPYLFSVD